MDNAHLSAYDADTQGQYYVVDTTVDPSTTANIKALNGRQGDTMRRVAIAVVDDEQPHDLTNSKIELRGQDSAGVVKISDIVLNMVSPTGGLLIFVVPAAFYQHAGQYQHAYFVITDKDADGNTTSTSTINVNFTVLENGVEVSNVDSTIYISSVDRLLSQAKSRVEAVKIMGDNAEATIKGYEDMIQSNAFPTKKADNEWTGTNSFTTVNIETLNNKQLSDVSNAVVTAQTTANSASLQAVSNSTLISNNSEAISSAANRLTSAETSIASVSSAVKSTDNKLASLASSVENIDTSGSSNTDVTSSLAHVNNSLISLSTEIDTLSTAVSNIPNYSTSINAVSATASQALATANTAQQNNNNLSAVLSDVQDNVTNISNTSYANSVNIDNLFSAVTALINTVNANIDNKKIDGNDVQHIFKQS